jgi:hypothetical protein
LIFYAERANVEIEKKTHYEKKNKTKIKMKVRYDMLDIQHIVGVILLFVEGRLVKNFVPE